MSLARWSLSMKKAYKFIFKISRVTVVYMTHRTRERQADWWSNRDWLTYVAAAEQELELEIEIEIEIELELKLDFRLEIDLALASISITYHNTFLTSNALSCTSFSNKHPIRQMWFCSIATRVRDTAIRISTCGRDCVRIFKSPVQSWPRR